ncbi:MAG: NrsF family protein, partial [Pseudomonadota bacterium]
GAPRRSRRPGAGRGERRAARTLSTDDLSARLAGDLRPAPAAGPAAGVRLAASAVLVAASSLALSSLLYGLRADGPSNGLIGLTIWSALARAGRLALARARAPDASLGRVLLVPAGGLLALLLVLALWSQADGKPMIRLDHVAHCLRTVGVLALAPFLCLSVFVRRGAPASPTMTGALAGLVAGAVGALAYSVSCPINDPMASLSAHAATVLVLAAAGAAIGRRLYAW